MAMEPLQLAPSRTPVLGSSPGEQVFYAVVFLCMGDSYRLAERRAIRSVLKLFLAKLYLLKKKFLYVSKSDMSVSLLPKFKSY